MFKAIDDFLIDRIFMPIVKVLNKFLGIGSFFMAAVLCLASAFFGAKVLTFADGVDYLMILIVGVGSSGVLTLMYFLHGYIVDAFGKVFETRKNEQHFQLRTVEGILALVSFFALALVLPIDISALSIEIQDPLNTARNVHIYLTLCIVLRWVGHMIAACQLPSRKKEKKTKLVEAHG